MSVTVVRLGWLMAHAGLSLCVGVGVDFGLSKVRFICLYFVQITAHTNYKPNQ